MLSYVQEQIKLDHFRFDPLAKLAEEQKEENKLNRGEQCDSLLELIDGAEHCDGVDHKLHAQGEINFDCHLSARSRGGF